MTGTVWFRRSDGIEFETEIDSRTHELMTGSDNFEQIDGAEQADDEGDGLDNLTKSELLQFAEDEGIEVNAKLKNADLANVIREALAERVEDNPATESEPRDAE